MSVISILLSPMPLLRSLDFFLMAGGFYKHATPSGVLTLEPKCKISALQKVYRVIRRQSYWRFRFVVR
jgi:hypothetical protein